MWAWTELVHKSAVVKRETLQFDCIWFLILHWVDALGLFLVGLITKQKGFGSFEAESQMIILRKENNNNNSRQPRDESNRIVILSIFQPCVLATWVFWNDMLIEFIHGSFHYAILIVAFKLSLILRTSLRSSDMTAGIRKIEKNRKEKNSIWSAQI